MLARVSEAEASLTLLPQSEACRGLDEWVSDFAAIEKFRSGKAYNSHVEWVFLRQGLVSGAGRRQ